MEEFLFKLLTYFIIYSIAGWILESACRSVCEKKIINTGFLNGPMCPIYGIGAIIMLLFLEKFQENPYMLFIIGFVVLSAWEYIVGMCLEKVFKTKYWDYSNQKINIKGRVCLKNSIYWGILGVVFIKYIHPFVVSNIAIFSNNWIFRISTYVITIVFIIDSTVSIVKVKTITSTLEKIEKLNAQIKEKIEQVKEHNLNKSKNEIGENLQLKIETLKMQKNRMFRRLYKRIYRLKMAFPTIETDEITEILSKKLETIKKEKEEKKVKKEKMKK